MSDEDENRGSIALARPEEESLRLKTLAEQKYTSGDLKSAVKYAKRAHNLHPSLDGLSEMLTAFKILRVAAAAPVFENSTMDYYKILQVERFSHINTIKKQYKKLALSLHPDRNPFAASEEAFKLVGEAMRVLSDKIRRKEYDMRLRIVMQSKAAEEVDLGAAETFWTACSACRLLHKFERRYLGHSLICPRCKKSFEAVEVVEDENNGGNVGGEVKKEGVEPETIRVSARIRERVAKGGNLGIKKKIINVDEDGDEDGVLLKDMRLKRVKKVGKPGGRDGGGIEGKLKEVRELVNGDRNGGSRDGGIVNELRFRRVAGKSKNGVEEEAKSGDVETGVSGRAKRAKVREEETMTLSQLQMKARNRVEEEGKSGGVETLESEKAKRTKTTEEETMTLFQFQMLAKRKKIDEGKLTAKQKEVNAEKLEEKGGENEKEIGEERETDKEIGEERETDKEIGEERETDKEIGEERETEEVIGEEREKEEGMGNMREKRNRRRVTKYRNLEVVGRTSKNPMNSKIESHRTSKKCNSEVTPVEKEKEKEKEMEGVREKRERRRVSKYGNLETMKRKTSENDVDSEIERLIATKKGNLEIMPVEDSDFHDFDKDRRERSFKKGQVWAVYDDDDGMPRHYALVDEIVSVNPFHVTLSWLQFQSSNGDEELISWQKMGFHVSCGRFKVSREVSIKYLNLFSHVVNCERAAREVYRIYPTKSSVWALYKNNAVDIEGRDQRVKDKNRCYDIVVCLSSYSDVYGLSVARLEKVGGFRTVFKRKEIGAKSVIWLGKNDVKLFSHQIPAKKLSGEEASGLPKDCWELDPASLTPQLLIRS
ncbi:hypothetical protein BUALT_Bualt05G0042300 [Buddleja alternifolia]|uniref:J domain-containing protein n=1 Tax=Buddleja alternifolia TaxID=168488 RepID=A0AAV6XSW6_9LAMI|nr:hypothetical protein BUALT_Bualt05G0042300 [Buddleja alternifolia]